MSTIKHKTITALLGLLLTSVALAAGPYSLFQPAAGILKGQTSTYITTAATSADVIATWSGVCSSSTYLRGDGTCATAAISGAAVTKTDDTNVTLTLGGSPSTGAVNAYSLALGWSGTLAASRGGLGMSTVTDDTLAVANGTIWQSKAIPDCDTGTSVLQYDTSTNAFSCGTNASPAGAALTKTDDTNVTLTLGGSPTTALVNAASITAGWTGQLSAARGGTGLSTVTDDTTLVANGTTWQSKALTDCDAATSAVTYDTTTNAWGCNTINGATGANPTGTIGLTAVNGVATTFLRSDGAPALSQAIAPTWTGFHSFTHANGLETASTDAVLTWRDTDGGADAKWWWWRANGGNFTLQTRTDAGSAGKDALLFTRSGTALSTVQLGNATDNPSFSFLGTGTATFGGPITANANTAQKVKFQSADTSGDVYMGFYENDGTTRKGYLGYGNVGDDVFFIAQEEAASVVVQTSGTTRLTVGTTAFTGTLPWQGQAGSAATPAFSFSTDTNSGVYSAGSDFVGLASNGAFVAGADVAQFVTIDGSAASPAVAFNSDRDTGIYRGAANTLSMATNGAVKMAVGDTNITYGAVTNQGQNGSASAPFWTFESDPNTGVYRVGADSLGITTGGTNRVTVGPGVQVGAPTGGDQGAGTVNATGLYINGVPVSGGTTATGTFTGTLTGYASNPTCSMKYRLTGSRVDLWLDSASTCDGTSNAATMTMTGLPSAIQPSRSLYSNTLCRDNSVLGQCAVFIDSSSPSVLVFYRASANTGTGVITFGNAFAASGAKGLQLGWGVTYDLGN